MRFIKQALWTSAALIGLALVAASPATADQVILDDLIVDGSLCVGFDCVNGESFGFDTIRLKENNLRIKALDTSNSASFPTTDWQITFNETTNGGANKFSIDDITNGRTPFTIEATAPSHSLYVDDGGRIGIGTSTPVADLHVKTGNTPTLRLEQDGSSGFTPQTWDVAGNEAGFFIRDATNGSTLPFRIIPGAASQSLVIDNDSQVGLNTGTEADAKLEVVKADGEVGIWSTTTGSGVETMLKLTAPDRPRFQFESTNSSTWLLEVNNGNFDLNLSGSGGAEEVRVDTSGNMTISGTTYNTGSSRSLKENFTAIDSEEILAKVAGLSLSTWNAKVAPGQRHLGPVAEDWWETFGLGPGSTHVSMTDITGVALAAIQGLNSVIEEKEARISDLDDRVAELEVLIQTLVESQN